MKRLIFILICALPAYGNEPPYVPLASCSDGICTMKQEDYEKFQRFHLATYENAVDQLQVIESLQRENASLLAKLNRTPFCQLRNL